MSFYHPITINEIGEIVTRHQLRNNGEFVDFLESWGTISKPHIRFHDLGHTHASLMLKSGIHPKIVSERLGHASVAFTLDTYSHVVPGLQEAAAERFDKMLDLDVSKMLAREEEIEREPHRTRTCNRLIKSQLLYRLS
jgi:hypothetical protein